MMRLTTRTFIPPSIQRTDLMTHHLITYKSEGKLSLKTAAGGIRGKERGYFLFFLFVKTLFLSHSTVVGNCTVITMIDVMLQKWHPGWNNEATSQPANIPPPTSSKNIHSID